MIGVVGIYLSRREVLNKLVLAISWHMITNIEMKMAKLAIFGITSDACL